MISCKALTQNLQIDPQGFVRICCQSANKLVHIRDLEQLSDIFDLPAYNDIQTTMNTTWHPNCNLCKVHEETAGTSRRDSYNEWILPKQFRLDINCGNQCNLNCRMCTPGNSTSWISDAKKLAEKDIHFQTAHIMSHELSKEDIEKILTFIKNSDADFFIELKGGEPFIMPRTEYFIEQLLLLPNANKISLEIVSNGTRVPTWIDKINKFKEFNLVLSFDGVDEVYSYIRNAEWHKFVTNLTTFKKYIDTPIILHTTLQNYNIHQYYIMKEFSDDNLCTWSNNILIRPNFLAINVLSPSAKEHVLKIMHNSRLVSIISKDYEPALLDKFYNYTNELDNYRNQNLSSTIPHLSNTISGFNL